VSILTNVKVFDDFADNFPDYSPISLPYFPILCKLDNLTLWNHIQQISSRLMLDTKYIFLTI